MKRPRRRLPHLVAGPLALMAIFIALVAPGSHPARAQAAKTIKIIVPFPAGGSADILARVLAEQIGRANGPSMVIENRPGAGASIGYEVLAHAAPDGGTLGIISNSVVINPILRKVNYDPLTDFAPVCYLVNSPQVIVVNSASPYRTLDELIAAAHAKPGELTFAALGPAATQHIGVEQLKLMAKADFTYVPYPGGAPATTALLGGHVTAVLENYSEAIEQMKAGKLRALAVTTATRIGPLPDIPTVAESGYPGYVAEAWFGVAAPAKTPKETVDTLSDAFTAALQAPDVKPKLLDLEMYPVGTCGDGFRAHIRDAYGNYSRIIREAHISAE